MAVEHTLVDMDTLPSLALAYFGDATRWREIADYNKLESPYIVTDKTELRKYFGSGYITIIRANYQNAVTLKKGWQFKTKPSALTSGAVKLFEVTEDTLIPAGVPTGYIPLQCTVAGAFGNVYENTITEVSDSVQDLSGIQFLSITNEAPFTGGRDLNSIRVTGDTIYIPTSSSEVIPEDVRKILELIGGTDIVLDVNGDLVFELGGDLATATGADNIQYAVASRIMTELGDLTLHPDYGTEIQDLIGSPNLGNREKLMEVAIIRALNEEDRVTDPIVNSLSILGTSIYVDISYTVAVNNTQQNVTLSF